MITIESPENKQKFKIVHAYKYYENYINKLPPDDFFRSTTDIVRAIKW